MAAFFFFFFFFHQNSPYNFGGASFFSASERWQAGWVHCCDRSQKCVSQKKKKQRGLVNLV